jgi:hypothetical protein
MAEVDLGRLTGKVTVTRVHGRCRNNTSFEVVCLKLSPLIMGAIISKEHLQPLACLVAVIAVAAASGQAAKGPR